MEQFFTIIFTSILTGIITGLTVNRMLKPEKKVSKKKSDKKKIEKKKLPSAKNSLAVNSVVDQQKIRTAEIEIPVIAEDVLTYEGGELGASYPDKTRLYYSADAIKDPEYLETVIRSPLQMQTHQKNTGEYNRGVDGWMTKVWFDDNEKRVKAKGILHGEENVKYAEENKHLPGFGTSAFISFLRIDKTPGTAPNGKPYDAIVRKAVNNHVAILPGIRDKNNVIVAMNAVENNIQEKTVDNNIEDDKQKNCAQNTPEVKKMPISKEEFKEAMHAYMADEKEESEKAERIKNAIKNELKEESGKTVTSTATGGNSPESSGKTAPNAETSTATGGNADSSKSETSTASNALPSEEMIKDFSTHLGISFAKTPTLNELGSLVGINAKTPAELISALNSKREELKKSTPKPEANNSNATLADIMASI